MFYRRNKEKLNSENIEYKPDSIVGNVSYSSRITVSHSCYRHFVIRSGEDNFYKQFNYFDLQEFDQEKVRASKRKFIQKEIKKWKEGD